MVETVKKKEENGRNCNTQDKFPKIQSNEAIAATVGINSTVSML